MGKTWVACAVAAALTRGWELPDGRTGTLPDSHTGEPQNVLYLTAENDPATIRFRIETLGGDTGRVFIWDTSVHPLPKLADGDLLDAAFAQVRPALSIIDPIQSGLDHRRNMDKANEVRPLLDALAALSRKYDCATLALGHLNKMSTQQAKHRIIGSIDFGAAPRSILIVAPHRDAGPEHRVLVTSRIPLVARAWRSATRSPAMITR
jgi:RecA-family ATPase